MAPCRRRVAAQGLGGHGVAAGGERAVLMMPLVLEGPPLLLERLVLLERPQFADVPHETARQRHASRSIRLALGLRLPHLPQQATHFAERGSTLPTARDKVLTHSASSVENASRIVEACPSAGPLGLKALARGGVARHCT